MAPEEIGKQKKNCCRNGRLSRE